MFTILFGFLAFTLGVAYISWRKTREENLSSSTGYFLGGRSLGGFVIASSLLLTNISAEQLVGLNGAGYRAGILVMGWSATAASACVLMALFLLPKYLNMGITTIYQFLAARYDDSIRKLVVALAFLGLALFGMPVTLYSGSLAMMKIIDVPELLGVSDSAALIITVLGIAVVGGIYAIFGGLKAVAISDTANGVGLLLLGLLVPVLGLMTLGDGSFVGGVEKLVLENGDHLNAIGSEDSPLPFSTFFTGLILAHTFAWSMNQSFIQRVLGAKSLEQGQKGVLLAGIYKTLAPLIITLPGVIAYALYRDIIPSQDLAYQTLVANVLPRPLLGIFLAVVFGAVLSTFNSQLNSGATIFCIDFYKPYINQNVTDEQLVKIGVRFSFILGVIAVILAPLIMNYGGGLYQYARKVGGFFNMPVLMIIVCGLYTRKVPPLALKVTTAFYILTYGYTQLVNDFGLHFLHISGVLVAISAVIIYVITKLQPYDKPAVNFEKPDINLNGWHYRYHASAIVLLFMVAVYMVLSPMGVVDSADSINGNLKFIGIFFVVASIVSWKACDMLVGKKKDDQQLEPAYE